MPAFPIAAVPHRPPKKIVLAHGPRSTPAERAAPAPAAAPSAGGRRRSRLAAGASWLLPPLLLGCVVAAALLVRGDLTGMFGVALALLFGAGFAWIVVSIFFPPRADRSCPRCGKDALARLDADTTRGLRCGACDYVDETASSWLLAEEEGPLERVVMRERGREPLPPEAAAPSPEAPR